jgi:selenocysteine lyase/cysteine desulfurase
MESYFDKFRRNTIGNDVLYKSPYGEMKMIYADWVASGRLYRPIEERIINELGPFVANTHTETSETGTLMTKAYHKAHKIIKEHCNAGKKDVIIAAGFGMTAVINKFQRILGLKPCNSITKNKCFKYDNEFEKPVVFITHMEHHSNHTSWYETIADVVVIQPNKEMLVDIEDLENQLKKYSGRKYKFGSFTAASNVTGIESPYYELSKLMHKYGGYCFVDFAAAAPYVDIDMHPEDVDAYLDAVMFSPHKFLGGPGTPGIIVFNSDLYPGFSPDQPGGGTVWWTNPWGEYRYFEDIEAREDGGTPGFLQTIKSALCIELKNEMGVPNMRKREEELLGIAFKELRKIDTLKILADNIENRLGILSFYLEPVHYNLVVRLLSDRFGIQVRGGCACAGTYGHYLLNVTYEQSKEITDKISHGDLSSKPGWIRLSIHPSMTNADLNFAVNAIDEISKNFKKWSEDYSYDKHTNEFTHKTSTQTAVDYNYWFRKLNN